MRHDRAKHGPETGAVERQDDPKRVVIVDDSASIRGMLRLILERDRRLTVVGEARDAAQARKIIRECNPDVITLDIEMPGMNGLEFLEKIMTLRPTPVVMISGSTPSNSESTIAALALGAVDYIIKPTPDEASHADVARRVFVASTAHVTNITPVHPRSAPQIAVAVSKPGPLVVIGASTGGVGALNEVLAGLDPHGPPVVIVQHMPGPFLVSFANSLNRTLPQDVGIARENVPLLNGQIRLAPGENQHTEVNRLQGQWVCTFRGNNENALYCPAVDRLFASAAPYGSDIIAVILTGMGRDGAEGMLNLYQSGAATIGQDEETSVVYGMPNAAWRLGAVKQQKPLQHIAETVNAVVRTRHLIKRERSSKW